MGPKQKPVPVDHEQLAADVLGGHAAVEHAVADHDAHLARAEVVRIDGGDGIAALGHLQHALGDALAVGVLGQQAAQAVDAADVDVLHEVDHRPVVDGGLVAAERHVQAGALIAVLGGDHLAGGELVRELFTEIPARRALHRAAVVGGDGLAGGHGPLRLGQHVVEQREHHQAGGGQQHVHDHDQRHAAALAGTVGLRLIHGSIHPE